MNRYFIYLGDREWERVYGESCVGYVDAPDLNTAWLLVGRAQFIRTRSHDQSPGYFVSPVVPLELRYVPSL